MKTTDNVYRISSLPEIDDMLTATLRQGAKQLLSAAVEQEVNEFLLKHSEIKDDSGSRLVVRNGYLPERKIKTGQGNVESAFRRRRSRLISEEHRSPHGRVAARIRELV